MYRVTRYCPKCGSSAHLKWEPLQTFRGFTSIMGVDPHMEAICNNCTYTWIVEEDNDNDILLDAIKRDR